MTLGQNIRRRRKARKMTLMELAEVIDWDDGNLSRLERGGQSTSEERIRKIAEALGTTIAELYSDYDGNIEPAPVQTGLVPLISWKQAGEFDKSIDFHQAGYTEDWVSTTVTIGVHTFALRVNGDSMIEKFPLGTIIIVEPDLNAKSNNFVIAKDDKNRATFKQLVIDGGDFYLKPLNDRYPIKSIDGHQIIGVVREAIQHFA